MACVVLLFNDAESLSYRDIAAATAIPGDDLRRRRLPGASRASGARTPQRKEPMSKDVNDDDVLSVNDNFTSKMIKVKISTVSAQRETELGRRRRRGLG